MKSELSFESGPGAGIREGCLNWKPCKQGEDRQPKGPVEKVAASVSEGTRVHSLTLVATGAGHFAATGALVIK